MEAMRCKMVQEGVEEAVIDKRTIVGVKRKGRAMERKTER